MKPSVLVIDDEKTFRIVAEEALSSEGFTVTTASNGEAGLRAWQREPCDLVILDRQLPDTDGIAVLEAMTLALASLGKGGGREAQRAGRRRREDLPHRRRGGALV